MPILWLSEMRQSVVDNWAPIGKTLMNWTGAGTTVDTMNLADMYSDWSKHLATWSSSNQGLPLGMYLGTKVRLFSNPEVDWMFAFDTTDVTQEQAPLTKNHPLHMFNKKERIVVWSQKTKGGKARTKKAWLPPPTELNRQWFRAKDLAQKLLFKYRASLFNPAETWSTRRTWGVTFDCMGQKDMNTWEPAKLTYFATVDEGQIKWQIKDGTLDNPPLPADLSTRWPAMNMPLYVWGYGYPPNYYMDGADHKPNPSSGHAANYLFIKQEGTGPLFSYNTGGYPQHPAYYVKWDTLKGLVANGPFTQLHFTRPVNITLQFKSYFKWGGFEKPINVPVKPNPAIGEEIQGIRDPDQVSDEVLTKADLDQHGLIQPRKFRWLTEPTDESSLSSDSEKKKETLHRSRKRYGRRSYRQSSEEKESEEKPPHSQYSTDSDSITERWKKRYKKKLDPIELRRRLEHLLLRREHVLKHSSTRRRGLLSPNSI